MEWTGTRGWYESDKGHLIVNYGPGRWMITWPGERAPDVERPTLREAKTYVETYP